MTQHATATFEVIRWDEEPGDEPEEGPKLTRAHVTKRFSGDLEGDGVSLYLLAHRPDGTATFVGYERITGTLGDRTGSFVLEHTGTFEGGTARTRWTIVAGSGTGELRGIRGRGGFASGRAKRYPMTLEYEVV